jgi:hypothetical protein
MPWKELEESWKKQLADWSASLLHVMEMEWYQCEAVGKVYTGGNMINQQELLEYFRLGQKLKAAEDKIRLAKAKMEDHEKQFIARLYTDEKVEVGSLTAYLRAEKGRAVVKWKDIVEEIKGAVYVEQVLQNAPRPVTEKLVVEVT